MPAKSAKVGVVHVDVAVDVVVDVVVLLAIRNQCQPHGESLFLKGSRPLRDSRWVPYGQGQSLEPETWDYPNKLFKTLFVLIQGGGSCLFCMASY